MIKEGKIKVSVIETLGNDLTVANAARVSFGGFADELTEKDEKLIDYLAKHQHLSPFEHCVMTITVECPLYIRSQIHRHRTFSYNEISRRYTDDGLEFYVPPTDDIRVQSKSNKQASDGALDEVSGNHARMLMTAACDYTLTVFERLIEMGVSREQARGILPQCLTTKFYMTGNLRNFAHFVQLRVDGHAQKEVQYVGLAVKAAMEEAYPVSAKALFAHGAKVS